MERCHAAELQFGSQSRCTCSATCRICRPRASVIFDRSWHNRAGVERVMGSCTKAQGRGFLPDAPLVEKAMVDSGIRLIKSWLEVSPEEQTRRVEARISHLLGLIA